MTLAPPRARFDVDRVKDALRVSEAVMRLSGADADARKSRPGKGDFWFCCPFHQERSASFHVDDRKGFYYCFGCHAKGDVIDFVAAYLHLQPGPAIAEAARLAGIAPEVAEADPAERDRVRKAREAQRASEALMRVAAEAEDRAKAAALALEWWKGAEPSGPQGGVAVYLRARGLDPARLVQPMQALRFSRLLYQDAQELRPVMLAVFKSAAGEVTGIHRTFLREDCEGKAFGASKKMFGTCWASCIRLGPPGEVLALAEGIETALAYHQWTGEAEGAPVPVWAAGSLGNLVAEDGCTVPEPVRELRLIADNDTKHLSVIREGMERAQAKFSRKGRVVRVITPPRGMDFLDWKYGR